MDTIHTVVMHPCTNVVIAARTDPAAGLRIVRTVLGSTVPPGSVASTDPELVRIADRVQGFLDGEDVEFRQIPVCFDGFTPFRTAVSQATRTVPRGMTISYAALAARAGYPGAARAAASVMRRNPFPLIVPCHRVVRSDGGIGGFMGRTDEISTGLKKALLRLED